MWYNVLIYIRVNSLHQVLLLQEFICIQFDWMQNKANFLQFEYDFKQ